LGRYKEALECYNEWFHLSGPDAELMVQIAHCYLKMGEYDKASRIFKKANRLDPYNDEVYYLIGRCHYKKGEYVSAIHQYQKAIRLKTFGKNTMPLWALPIVVLVNLPNRITITKKLKKSGR